MFDLTIQNSIAAVSRAKHYKERRAPARPPSAQVRRVIDGLVRQIPATEQEAAIASLARLERRLRRRVSQTSQTPTRHVA